MRTVLVIASALVAATAYAQAPADKTYTLYRDSVTDANMRIHIATFNANEKEQYNRENCDIARKLFSGQPGVKVRYWCEKGRYRK